MVEFTQTDFKILLVMTLTLILISFIFPAMGFTSDGVNASDIPDFNASQNQFEYLNDDIPSPSTPNEGTLEYIEGAVENEDNRQVWLERYEYGISMFNTGSTNNPVVQVNLVNQSAPSGSNIVSKQINQSEFVNLEGFGYQVSFHNLQFENNNETISVDWQVNRQRSEEGFIESIPVLGGLAGVAAALGWFTEIILVVVTNAVLTVTNIFIALFNIMSFIFGFMYWLLSTYGGIIASSPAAWVTIFLSIPGVILSFEFAKLMLLLVRTIIDAIPLT